MNKGKFGLSLISAVVLVIIILLCVHTAPETPPAHPVAIQAGDETVSVWTADGENYYGFLPSHIRFEEAVLLPQQDTVTLDDMGLPVTCDALEPAHTYRLAWEENGRLRQGTLHLMDSSGVATLYLNTQSGSTEYIHKEKGNAERGSIRLYDAEGELNYSGSLKSVRGRGNSTWVVHEKKPYSLKLMDEADLLDMGKAKDWILLADALDSSAMRNKIVYDFAAKAGLAFTPECRWTEVYLNGDYAGLYLLSERVEVHEQRVNLSPDGSLVCMDRDIRVESDTAPYFVTDSSQYLQIRESSDLGTLKRQFQSMENAILAEDGRDTVTGEVWENLIDLESWVKKYLIEEIFDSYDANFQSQYYYCYETEVGSRIYAGPIWDYDASIGNPSVWALNSPQSLFAWRPEAMSGYATPWLHSLYEKPAFREELEREYREVFLPLLMQLEETVDAYAAQIAPAFDRNQIRWKVDTLGVEAEAEAITGFMAQRTAFLSQLWLEGKEFCVVRLQENDQGGYYAYYAVELGTTFDDLPVKEGDDFLGWYREDTQIPFDPAEPVTEDLFLYPKYDRPAQEPGRQEDSLKDLILQNYHYVPFAVLVLMGMVVLILGLRRGRKGRKREPAVTR